MIPNELKFENIVKIYDLIKPYINSTPLIKATEQLDEYFNTNLYLKCEFFQKGGSFKARGAVNNILSMNKKKLKNGGVTAVSAGNHAIAVSYVANLFNLKNKIFIYKTANKYRIKTCKNFDANLIFTDPVNAFNNVLLAEKDGYNFIHPFDGPNTIQGSATLGLELHKEFKKMNKTIDNIIVSVGGGGLISGVGALIKQKYPKVKIFGIEPENAKGMTESLKLNKPLDKVFLKKTIADSLATPLHKEYSFSIAKQIIDKMINVTDDQMINSMLFAFNNLKLALEPACVAGLAGLKYNLKNKLKKQNTILILCGSSIDYETWKNLVFK